jgi:hypothetical protein
MNTTMAMAASAPEPVADYVFSRPVSGGGRVRHDRFIAQVPADVGR